MTIEELKDRIIKLEDIIFCLELVDHWTKEQNEKWTELNKELTILKQLVVKELVK